MATSGSHRWAMCVILTEELSGCWLRQDGAAVHLNNQQSCSQACSNNPDNCRILTFVLAAMCIISNCLTAAIFVHLPSDDPLQLIRHLNIYSWFAGVLSVLGCVGAWKGNAVLVTIFANYLLIDTILCAVPRLLVLTLFGGIRDLLCSAQNVRVFLQGLAQTSSPIGSSSLMATPADVARADRLTSQLRDECRSIVGFVQMLVAAVAVAAVVVQVVLALRVNRYARWLGRQELEREEGRATVAFEGLEEKGVACA